MKHSFHPLFVDFSFSVGLDKCSDLFNSDLSARAEIIRKSLSWKCEYVFSVAYFTRLIINSDVQVFRYAFLVTFRCFANSVLCFLCRRRSGMPAPRLFLWHITKQGKPERMTGAGRFSWIKKNWDIRTLWLDPAQNTGNPFSKPHNLKMSRGGCPRLPLVKNPVSAARQFPKFSTTNYFSVWGKTAKSNSTVKPGAHYFGSWVEHNLSMQEQDIWSM